MDSQIFHDLMEESTPFHCTHEHEKLFQQIKDRISEDSILALPSADYAFHIHVDSSNVSTGCFQFNSFLRENEKLPSAPGFSTKLSRKCQHSTESFPGIVSALQTYEHHIIGSPFAIYLFCDHKLILYLWGRKPQSSHRFFRYQVIITKVQNFKIIWTTGSNLAFLDPAS